MPRVQPHPALANPLPRLFKPVQLLRQRHLIRDIRVLAGVQLHCVKTQLPRQFHLRLDRVDKRRHHHAQRLELVHRLGHAIRLLR